MSETLEQVIADVRGDIAVLRRNKHGETADRLEDVIDRIATASRDFTTWISETDAMARSGHSQEWLRQRFATWQRCGHARYNEKNPRERQYLLVIIPLAANTEAARGNARRTARAEVKP